MSRLGIFIADGCEEVEALTVVDIVRRAKLEIDMISINGTKQVTSSRNVTFMTDTTKEEADFSAYDGIILPGGMPGTVHLGEDDTVSQVIREFAKEGKLVAAICAAPSVLGQAGILNGKKAACHPGFEEKLTGAEVFFSPVVCDGNVITSRGMGTAVPFGLAVARYFTDDATVRYPFVRVPLLFHFHQLTIRQPYRMMKTAVDSLPVQILHPKVALHLNVPYYSVQEYI